MDLMDSLQVLLRWTHVFGGIIWIGFLFFFGFVFSPSMAELGPEVRNSVYGAFMGRTTRWIRPSTLVTYITGLVLLGTVFHGGGLMFESGHGWGPWSGIAALLPFILFVPYDLLAKSKVGANLPAMGIAFVLISMAYLLFMTDIAGMTYRASMIHLGFFYGTIMAANVFMRVLPVQRRVLAAMSENRPPDPSDLLSTQSRAKHNVYLTIPLVWTMLNQHTVVPGASSPLWFLGVLFASILFVMYLYKPASPRT